MTRFGAVGVAVLTCWGWGSVWAADVGKPGADVVDPASERGLVEQWRSRRVADLTGEHGWLTLAGLFWLEKGANSFGRSSTNKLVLANPALAAQAGKFVLEAGKVQFIADRSSRITHGGRPVGVLDMVPDSEGEPTVMSSGPLRIWIIGRSGKLGVRVRDLDSLRRREFKGIDYYPVDTSWVFEARFEPYAPHRRIPIVNILGLEEDMDCPGTLVFERDGQQLRLDALLEDPHDDTLFVMFNDRTNGHGSYGGGRFLDVPLPAGGKTRVDFNESYNPPCAFNEFATCPLPPPQNRLTVSVEAGEKSYEAR
jgi:uncharacterized protein (DUF1684 family)